MDQRPLSAIMDYFHVVGHVVLVLIKLSMHTLQNDALCFRGFELHIRANHTSHKYSYSFTEYATIVFPSKLTTITSKYSTMAFGRTFVVPGVCHGWWGRG